jgi:hypothetical protein
MRMRSRFLYSSLVLSVLSSARVHAEPGRPSESAEQDQRTAAFDRGVDAMTAKNWELAHGIFSELWTQQQSFDVASSLGQTELNLKRYRDAAEHLAFSIRTFPAREQSEMLAAIQAGLAEAKRHVATVNVSVNRDGATVLVDGKAIGRSPLPPEIFLDPGQHKVEADLENFERARTQLVVDAGTEHVVTLRFGNASPSSGSVVPAPTSGAQAPGAGPHSSRTLIYVTGAVAGAGALTGIAGILLANQKDDERERRLSRLSGTNECGPGTVHTGACSDLKTLADGAKTWRAVSWVGFGTALAAGVATVLLAWPDDGAEGNVGVRAIAIPDGSQAGVFTSLTGRF